MAALLHIRQVRQEYLETVELRSHALAQPLEARAANLSGYSAEMQRTLGLNVDCQLLLQKNRAGGLVHVGVLATDGRVIAHTNTSLVGKVQQASTLRELLARGGTLAAPAPDAYHTFIPVRATPTAPPVAVIDIGFSRETITLKRRDILLYAAGSFVAFLLLSFLLISALLSYFVTAPIAALSKAAARLAQGDHTTDLGRVSSDEVGLLAASFERMRGAIQEQFGELNREIHEREEAQRLLGAREEDLRVTLESIGDAVIATDTAGHIRRMNPVAEALTGWGRDEALGLSLDEVFRVIDTTTREPAESPVESVLAPGKAVPSGNHTVLLARDGVERQIASSGGPITNDQSEVVGVVLVFRDVTRERELQNRLRHSEKMDAIGQLAGGVAHDFNNMLAGILGSAELLRGLLPRDDEDAHGLHSIITESAERAADLAQKLLTCSHSQPTATTRLNAQQAVDDALGLLRLIVDKRIQIETDFSAKTSRVVGSHADLQSAFLNLGINASHAMPDGGLLSVRSTTVHFDAEYCATSAFNLAPGEFLELVVSDTGSGIAPENLSRVFEPFFSTKERGKGTGLGLAAVYGTVTQHDGMISVTSELGVGTSFRLCLPLAPTVSPSTDDDADKAKQVIPGRGQILVIEDEPDLRAIAKKLLTKLGYDVTLAEDGAVGLATFTADPSGFDLVLLDMVMPSLNGRDCFTALQAAKPDVKVILCTGFSGDEDLDELSKLGLCGVLRKPYSSAVLSQALHAALKPEAPPRSQLSRTRAPVTAAEPTATGVLDLSPDENPATAD
jgi:PAS domain S-box-containing protein